MQKDGTGIRKNGIYPTSKFSIHKEERQDEEQSGKEFQLQEGILHLSR